MPAAPAAPPAGGGGAAKTMFGYAAPVLKPGQQGVPAAPAPAPRPAPPQGGGFPPPQGGGFPPPGPQGGGFPPPQGGGFPPPGQPQGFPPPGQPQGFGPPQGGGFPPPQGGGFPPPGQPQGFPPPGQQPPQGGGFPPQGPPQGFGPPQGGGFPPPGQQPPPMGGGFPPPGQQPPPQFGGPQPGFGQPPMQPPPQQPPPQFGGPQPGFGQPPMQQPPMQQPPMQQPPMGQPPMQPPQGSGLPGALGGLPASAPGTIFGIPVSRLRDTGLQRKALFLLGIAMAASAFVPWRLSPLIFGWKSDAFRLMIWPIVAGASYWLVAAAPQNIREKIPPVVLQWLPFGVSFSGIQLTGLGLGILGHGMGSGAGIIPTTDFFYSFGAALLVFGLLARIQNPEDQIARIIMAIGAGMWAVEFLSNFHVLFKFDMVFLGIHNHIYFLVLLVGALTLLYLVPPSKLPPALKAIDGFAPMVAALIILWLPAQGLLLFLSMFLDKGGDGIVNSLLFLAHYLLFVAGYFGVLMFTAPAAYDEAMAFFKKQNAGQQPPPPPPQGGGYPPPQGGGYPPPQGGGYPPQQGGGWPQQ